MLWLPCLRWPAEQEPPIDGESDNMMVHSADELGAAADAAPLR
jgi:hypothetical protein